VPVCPHAGGVGLCELVQHLATFDYIAVSGSLEGRMIEYVDHLHEHFVSPVIMRSGRYVLPSAPGYGAEMWPESLRRFSYPDGPEWAGAQAPSAATAAEAAGSEAPARVAVGAERASKAATEPAAEDHLRP
jgi:L-fuconate dehydratase